MSGINIQSQKIIHRLNKAQQNNSDSLEKLSSGQVFTRNNPRPADRAIAEGLELKLRSLSASKRNINDAISLLQTADSGFSELTNILVRMKEINTAAASTTMNDKERKFLFIEYNALHDEMNRIARTTEFNSIPILNGEDERTPESLIFRLSDPVISDSANNDSGDLNEVNFDNLRDIIATPKGLGIRSVQEFIESDDDIDIEDAMDLLEAENDDEFATVYDEALNKIGEYRASFGAIQNRLQIATNYNDVVEENIAAAKSNIADTDYVEEISRLTHNSILLQANTALLGQANFNTSIIAGLLSDL